jgi:uncharacterized membrane protein
MRKPTPDIIKGIAVLLMIQVHLIELLAKLEIYQSTGGKILLFLGGPPAAPVFMTIMGYFLFQTKKSFNQQLIRGSILVGLGLMLNFLLNASALIMVFKEQLEINPLQLLFGADILFLAGIGIIIIALINKIFDKWFWSYLILSTVIAAVSFFVYPFHDTNSVIAYLMAYVGGNYSWSYFPIIPWLSYILLGVWFCSFEKRYFKEGFKNRQLLLIAITAFVFLAAGSFYAFRTAVDLPAYYHHNLIFFLWVCVFIVFYLSLTTLFFRLIGASIFSKALCWIGKNLTSIYIIQWVIIGNLATFLYKTQDRFQLLLWFIGITACTIGVVSLYGYLLNIRRRNMIM